MFPWLLFLVYAVASDFGVLPLSWARFVVPVAVSLSLASVLLAVPFLLSARRDTSRSQHGDPDVRSLIDGEINLEQYGQRKSEVERNREG
jgi:hypothetical protein